MFPDHSKGFSDLAQAPQEFDVMDEEAGQEAPGDVDSSSGQSLVRGQMLDQVVALQQRSFARQSGVFMCHHTYLASAKLRIYAWCL